MQDILREAIHAFSRFFWVLIPVAAIVSNAVVKHKRLELKRAELGNTTDPHAQEVYSEMLKELKTLRATNTELTQRLQTVERSLANAERQQPYREIGSRDALPV